MQQFDVFQNPSADSAKDIPYLVVVQSGILSELATQVVIPLVRIDRIGRPLTRLNPAIEIGRHHLVLWTQQIGALPSRLLKRRVGSLELKRSIIVSALDVLISGV